MGIMIQTAILVMAILAVRKLFGERLHAYIRYSLWMLVVLRLVIPFNLIDIPFSLLSVTDMAVMRYQEAAYTSVSAGGRIGEDGFRKEMQDGQMDRDARSMHAEDWAAGSAPGDGEPDDRTGNIMSGNRTADGDDIVMTDSTVADGRRISERLSAIFRIIWVMGSLAVGGFLLIANCRFRARLYRRRQPVVKDRFDRGELSSADRPGLNAQSERKSLLSGRADKLPVYQVKGLEVPCLAGFIHPAVYIGSDIDPESNYFRYIITHEKVHYLHGDHIWSLLRIVLVAVYWFHPFVWIAAAASARDGEIACDHGTVRRLGEKERMTYGTMLLDLAGAGGRKRIYSYGTMLRSERSEIKERILRLAGGKESRVSVGFFVILFMLVVAGCAFTGVSQENRNMADGTGGAAEAALVLPDNKENMIANGDTDGADGSGINGGLSYSESPFEKDNAPENADLPGTDSEDTDINEASAIGEPFDPEENISGQRQLTAVSAALSEETLFGADGPTLDYVGMRGTGKESIIIFHDYFGLVVYDLTNRKVLQSLDLARIGCHMTQGDNVCQIRVAADGMTVWLHPKTRQYMFRYEIEKNLLYQVPLVKTFDIDLEAEDLFERYLVTEENREGWHSNYLYEEYKDEKGLHTAYIYLFISGEDEQQFGSLKCVWDDMVYILCDQDGAWMEEAAGGFPYRTEGAVADVEIWYDEPCTYSRISNPFGSRVHPVTGEVIVHEGIDYVAEEGTDVTAAADGVVYEKGSSYEYGNYIVLLHANGDMTYYCHCREITAADGAQVKRGEKIAAVGNTGRSTGAHLHFALSRNGWFVDPAEYMEGYIVQLEE